jgi:hypothetical protein
MQRRTPFGTSRLELSAPTAGLWVAWVKRTPRAALVLIGLVLPSGCNLRSREQRRFCAHATLEECRQRPEWCYAEGGARCEDTDGHVSEYCEPDVHKTHCVLRPDSVLRESCPQESRWIGGGALKEPNGLPDIPFGEAVRAGDKLSQNDVAGLSASERQLVCAAQPNTPCQLTFDVSTQLARCEVPPDLCSAARLVVEPEHCWARNLCSDLICL